VESSLRKRNVVRTSVSKAVALINVLYSCSVCVVLSSTVIACDSDHYSHLNGTLTFLTCMSVTLYGSPGGLTCFMILNSRISGEASPVLQLML